MLNDNLGRQLDGEHLADEHMEVRKWIWYVICFLTVEFCLTELSSSAA